MLDVSKESDLEEMKINPERPIHVSTYRRLVRTYIDLHLYNSALFWADKVVSLSDSEPEDVLWLAQCMYLLKQYHRAAFLLKNKNLHKDHLICRYLAGKCLFKAREYNEALELLTIEDDEDDDINFAGCSGIAESIHLLLDHCISQGNSIKGFPIANLHSAALYLKGCVYEALDNRSLASECYKEALKRDVFCFDAFQALVQHQMLNSKEESDLIASLPIADQCKTKDDVWLVRSVYESLLKKYYTVPERSVVQVHPRLKGNLDLRVAEAERHYYACAYTECFKITQEILEEDPYHMACLPIHIAGLVELKKTNALFYLAHDLVDIRPDLAVSWFAVGCYYFIKGKTDPARRYLGKATSLDRLFGPAWLAYGHSFAVENEHDQAMAAYFKASQLMKGCHLPLLYIGLECGLTNNNKLAEKFFHQARIISPNDPFILHEMGIIAFQNTDFFIAESYFELALEKIRIINEPLIADKWEALFNNLGHTCRKLKKYDRAIEYHQQALILSPQNASTLAAIGFIEALKGDLEKSAESFHKALGIRRDDMFSTTMLSAVLEQLAGDSPPYIGEDAPGLDCPLIVNAKQPEDSSETPLHIDTSPAADEMDMTDSFQDENNT